MKLKTLLRKCSSKLDSDKTVISYEKEKLFFTFCFLPCNAKLIHLSYKLSFLLELS